MTLSEFADTYRYIADGHSPFPGRWKTSRTPYLKEPMDCVSSGRYKRIVLMFPAQAGKSSLLENIIAFFAAAQFGGGGPMLLVMPTESMAKEYSKGRISGMFRDTPILQETLTTNKKDSDNTILHKEFLTGSLSMVGSNSNSSVCARTIKVLLLDEIERYPPSTSEGDVVSLAERRAQNYTDSVIVLSSTPVDEGGPIHRAYLDSDRRIYQIKCTHCEEHFTPNFKEHVKWEKDVNEQHLPDTAVIVCPYCDNGINEGQRLYGIRYGKYKKRQEHYSTAGFTLPAMCIPWISLPDMVRAWLKAQGSTSELKVFRNTILALPWVEKFTKPDEMDLLNRGEDFTPQTLPQEVCYITAGCDVQGNRIEITTIGWLQDQDGAIVIDHTIIPGDPLTDDIYREVEDYLIKTIFTREDGAKMRILATGFDSGYATDKVYSFCNKWYSRRVWALKGSSTPGAPIYPRITYNKKKQQRLLMVGTDNAKTLIYGWMNKQKDELGYVRFPQHLESEYYRQLTCERMISHWIKNQEYKKFTNIDHTPNEALDCFVYALVAKTGLMKKVRSHVLEQQNLRTIVQTDTQDEVDEEKPVSVVNTRKNNIKMPQQRGGWMRGLSF